LGDYGGGEALASRSLGLTERDGLRASPWAWLAKVFVAFYTDIAPGDGLRFCEHAVDVSNARHDEFAAVLALGMRALFGASLGDPERSSLSAAEALRRAELSRQPVATLTAVLAAAGNHLWRTEPDFAASLSVLEPRGHLAHFDDSVGVWVELIWGATLAGLHRTDAVGRLARAVRIADRIGALQPADLILRLLALVATDAGYPAEAATLAGYADANLRPYRATSPGFEWVSNALEDALAGVADRVTHQAYGAQCTRSQMLSLVTRIDSVIDNDS
jgi:hypothetical protein